ncbi:MAG: hypothetical protein IJ500_03585 [Alphaproteobacteria bacterium]|nr:hypothetical protein [Alphaproteobacteria bacterium]
MKTELKISSLALICALCTVVATPAMSAAPVRSLGGAGTYTSASSAAASKTSGASTRAGAMRVLPSTTKATSSAKTSTTSATTSGAVTSTRAAMSPRLSIGKYLGGTPVKVVTGGSSSGGSSSGGTTGGEFVDVNDPLWLRVAQLPDKFDDLEAGVGVLEERVDALEKAAADGVVTDEEFKTVQDSVAAVESQVAEIENAIADLPADVVGKTELQSEIDAVKALIPSADDLAASADVVQLKTDVSALQGSVADMEKSVTDLEAALATKQNVLTAGQYIEIVNDTVSLKYADLVADLEKIAGNTVDISYDDATHTLSWSIDGGQESATITFDDTYETIANVQAADKLLQESIDDLEERVAALETQVLEFVKTAELEASVTALEGLIAGKQAIGDYAMAADLTTVQNKLDEMSKAGYVTSGDLTELQAALQTEIDKKQNSGDYVLTTTLNSVQSSLNDAIAARATADQLAALKTELEEQIAQVQAGGVEGLENYALKSEVESALVTKADASVLADYALLADLESAELAIAALQDADSAMDIAVKALQDADKGFATSETLNAKVVELTAADAALQAAIESLENTIPSIDGLATEEYVNSMVEGLSAVDDELRAAIKAIKEPDVDQAYVDAAVESLNSAIDGLKAADTTMQGAIDSINSTLATLATKDELKDTKAELQAAIDKINAGDVELANYYTKTEADNKFAAKADLGALAYKDTVEAAQITSIDGSVIEMGTVTADKISTGNEQMAAGDFAMLVSDGNGGVTWASVDVAE